MKKLLSIILSLILLPTFAFAGELTKETVVEKMEVLPAGHVQVRQAIRTMEDGKVISQQFHRYVVSPGDDYSTKEAKVKAVCQKVHTPEVIAAYQDSISENPTKPPATPGLVKETKVGKIYILEDGTLVVEKVTQVLDDGKVIGRSVIREKILPGTDVSKEASLVKDIAEVIQTKDVVDAYKVTE